MSSGSRPWWQLLRPVGCWLAAGVGGLPQPHCSRCSRFLRTDEFVTGPPKHAGLGGTTALRQMFGVRGAFMSSRFGRFQGSIVTGSGIRGHLLLVLALALAFVADWHIRHCMVRPASEGCG